MKPIMIPPDCKELYDRLAADARVLEMAKYRQHGRTTTYDHCLHVAKASCWLGLRFRLPPEKLRHAVAGAVLHDFYLYDYHGSRTKRGGWHAWKHPETALRNASAAFGLCPAEMDVIRNHMFPGTLFHMPRRAESWTVCLADKICSVCEYFRWPGFAGACLVAA